LAFSQKTEKEDSTFVLLESGEVKQVQNTHASIEFVTPLVMHARLLDIPWLICL